jgi:hypothetical protein
MFAEERQRLERPDPRRKDADRGDDENRNAPRRISGRQSRQTRCIQDDSCEADMFIPPPYDATERAVSPRA